MVLEVLTIVFIIVIGVICFLWRKSSARLGAEVYKARSEVEIVKLNHEAAQRSIDAVNHEREMLDLQLSQARETIVAERQRVTDSEAKLTAIQQDYTSLQKEHAELQASCRALNERAVMQESIISDARQKIAEQAEALDATRKRLETATAENSRLNERIEGLAVERKKLAEETEKQFKVLASEIMESNSKRFNEQSHDHLSQVLNPLKEDIQNFKKSVTEAYSNEARERFALTERIKELVKLNESIGREAKELTRALRGDSKVQGDWGEMILEGLLEKSGLQKGIHFDLQLTRDENGETFKGEDNTTLRPDAVIYYPGDRCAIVDSKVSLTAYIDMINAEPGTTDYQQAAERHLRSVRAHIKELATKRYQDFIGNRKADFVSMFIPNEGAYMAAMHLDHNLWEEAYKQRVLIVSPTHLISVLKLTEQMWKQENANRNTEAIAEQAGKMYDKLVGLTDDLLAIGKALDQTKASYDASINKLSEGRGNLLGQAEKMRKLGIKNKKFLNKRLLENEDQEPADTE